MGGFIGSRLEGRSGLQLGLRYPPLLVVPSTCSAWCAGRPWGDHRLQFATSRRATVSGLIPSVTALDCGAAQVGLALAPSPIACVLPRLHACCMAGQIKGLALYHLANFARDRLEPQAHRLFNDSCGASERPILENPDPMVWYSLDIYAALLGRLAEAKPSDYQLLEDYGRYCAEQDITRVHRYLAKLAEPGLVFQQVMKLWRRFHDTGRWEVQREVHRATGSLHAWGCVDENLCREMVGYIGALIGLSVRGDVAVYHPHCRATGSRVCVFTATWS